MFGNATSMIGLCQEGKGLSTRLGGARVYSFYTCERPGRCKLHGEASLVFSESASAEFSFSTPSAPPPTYTFKLIVILSRSFKREVTQKLTSKVGFANVLTAQWGQEALVGLTSSVECSNSKGQTWVAYPLVLPVY